MRLTFGDEVEAFRREFLGWLAENRPTEEERAAMVGLRLHQRQDISARPTGRAVRQRLYFFSRDLMKTSEPQGRPV